MKLNYKATEKSFSYLHTANSFSQSTCLSSFTTNSQSLCTQTPQFTSLDNFETNTINAPTALVNFLPAHTPKRTYQKKNSKTQQRVSSNVLGSNNLSLNQRSGHDILNRNKAGLQNTHHYGEIIPNYEVISIARAKSRMSRQNTFFSKIRLKNYLLKFVFLN